MKRLTKQERTFLRLASARADVYYARQAYTMIQQCPSKEVMLHLFTSMVTSYCRPFTENYGLGSLFIEYPDYPDFEDPMMNLRHSRMMDVRNKFLSHSSVEGTRLLVIPPNVINPMNERARSTWDYNIAKRHFVQPKQRPFIDWLAPLCDELGTRLDRDVDIALTALGNRKRIFDRTFEIDTGADAFQWSIPDLEQANRLRPTSPRSRSSILAHPWSTISRVFSRLWERNR